MDINDSPFIKACWSRNDDQIPVWIMRQAGRYLPEYRALREKVSFLELCRTPELIAEAVRQPVERFGLDAAILFSDILLLLEPMGVPVSFPEGGPELGVRISEPSDVERLRLFDVEKEMPFVSEGIRAIRKKLPDTPLIGFAGSPFTLACYLIEGHGSKNFDKVRRFMHQYPMAAGKLIDLLADITGRYLEMQIKAGAHAVQIFDSWGGTVAHEDYKMWSAKPISRIFTQLRKFEIPRILFVNNVAPYLDIVKDIDCEVVSVDYRIDLSKAALALPDKAVQGNLDPTALFSSPAEVESRVRQILDSLTQYDNLIFNLGHGILPQTPVESVEVLVKTVHEYGREN